MEKNTRNSEIGGDGDRAAVSDRLGLGVRVWDRGGALDRGAVRGDGAGELTEIEVTQQDIDNGDAGSWVRCPVALAIKRATGLTVHVTGEELGVPTPADRRHYRYAPEAVTDFVVTFDSGKPVKPFTFEMQIHE